jgi:hypothetical protein
MHMLRLCCGITGAGVDTTRDVNRFPDSSECDQFSDVVNVELSGKLPAVSGCGSWGF